MRSFAPQVHHGCWGWAPTKFECLARRYKGGVGFRLRYGCYLSFFFEEKAKIERRKTANHGGRGDLRRLRVGAGERVFLWNLHDLNELLALRLAMCTSYYSLPRSQIFPLLALRTRTCCSQ